MTEPSSRPNGVVERRVVVLNRFGMHARPASLLVKTASRFQAETFLVRGPTAVSVRSIMGVLTLGCEPGTALFIRGTGPDAEAAVAALAELFEKKFFEE